MNDKNKVTKFTIYWLDGTKEILEGESLVNAFMLAGYGAGAVRAVDFTCMGDNSEYEWINHKWIKIAPNL